MKKLLTIVLLLIIKTASAQLSTPNGTVTTTTNPETGNVGIGTVAPLSSTNNLGLQINRGGHSTIMLGSPTTSSNGGVIQTSDNRHRIFIGANLYDDPTLSWRNFQSGKGGAGISILADKGDWGTSIDFYTSGNDNAVEQRMTINQEGNIGIGTTTQVLNSIYVEKMVILI